MIVNGGKRGIGVRRSFFSSFSFFFSLTSLGGEHGLYKANFGLPLREKTKLFQNISQFTDIRKKPVIPLQHILLSVLFMVFFNLTSLLALDRMARKEKFKKLFRCKRKMVVSDSTVARVLLWLDPEQAEQFQSSFLELFEEEALSRRRLAEGAPLRRIGIIDGSEMGSHWLCAFNLCGKSEYPVILMRFKKYGKELPAAHLLLDKAKERLGKLFPKLILVDGLYFNKPFFDRAYQYGAQVVIKSEEPFRDALKDAQFFLEAKDKFPAEVIEKHGFDSERCCSWKIEITSGEFAGYPLQIAHLVEDYPKRKKDKHLECWIATTDLTLCPEEIREAAHLRWHIENNLFKRLSKQAGTKQFYFKDHRKFFNLLRLFFAAIALFGMILHILQRDEQKFKCLLNGIKFTWNNVFSQLEEGFTEGFLCDDLILIH
jgi:hypothetical protein